MSRNSQPSLSLQDIKELGGTKNDLELLEGVDNESASELEFDSEGVDGESEDLSKNEIQSFIQGLGLQTAIKKKQLPVGNNDLTDEREGIKQGKKVKQKSSQEGEDLSKMDKKKLMKMNIVKSERDEGSYQQVDEGVCNHLLHLSAKSYKRLLVSVDDELMWYDKAQSSGPACPVPVGVTDHLLKVGEALMKNEVATHEQVRQKRKGASEVKWLKTVLSSGTLSDKMAALTLLVQESPVHALTSLDSLIAMASKKGKRECVLAVDTLKELWITDLLPESRKLKTLKQRPLDQLLPCEGRSLQHCHQTLLLWYFEHQLKNRYAQYLTILKGLSHDTVANVREKMVGHIFDLLHQRPEQEQELLNQLVNKIGDPIKKIASKAVLFLLKLLSHHVNMKVIVATAIEHLLHRPNIGQKAQYYCICCLNQFTIAPDDQELAGKLIDIFFTFFKIYVKRGQLDAKMLGALLTGVNRAFPFLKGDIPSFEEHLHSLFTVVHTGPLATGIQSLVLLYQVMESRHSVSSRYYQALYAKLMDPALKHSGKQAMFLNLLFKSVKSDPEVNRVKAFLKRIIQVCSAHAPSFICGCLFLISEILKHKPTLWSFVLQSERSDEERFVDVDSDVQPVEGHVTKGVSHVTNGIGYRVAHRNPLYCGAEHTSLWELSQLTQHYHPSVQVFAKKIISGEHIDYRGDPLADFTLMRFLDRFVYKNPKQKQSDHGGSVMQRMTKLAGDSTKEILVNSSQFASMDESKVRVEELFMHRYFTQKAASEINKKKKKEKKEREEEGGIDIDRFSSGSQSDSDMDFAGELERQVKSKRHMSKKAKRKVDGSSDGSGGDDSVEEGGSGSDLDDAFMSDEDSLVGGGAAEPTDAQMERLLLDNLSSDSDLDEGEEEKAPPRKKRKKNKGQFDSGGQFDPHSLFAAADEFAHLLEDSGVHGGRHDVRRKDKASEKQLQWEESKSRSGFSKRRQGAPKKKGKSQSDNQSGSRGGGRSSSVRTKRNTGQTKRTGPRRNFGNKHGRRKMSNSKKRK